MLIEKLKVEGFKCFFLHRKTEKIELNSKWHDLNEQTCGKQKKKFEIS